MKHTDAALRRPVTTLMICAALCVVGAVAARLLPLEQFPDISFPFMGVSIPYPGSTPEEVEELVTRPVEDALAMLPGIKQIRSRSTDAEAQFQIGFDWGTDLDAASFEVRTKLDSIRSQLPAAANRILMFTASTSDQSVLTIRLSAARDLSTQYDILDRYLKKPIERLDGVARVDLAGVAPRELRILLDAGRIAAHGIQVERVVRLLQRSNFSVSAGWITDRGQRLTVRPVGELSSVDQVRNLVVEGNVRLRDLASVEFVSPELTIRRNLNGRPAVGVDVFKSAQANVVDVVERVLQVVEAARKLPQMEGITIFVIDDQARNIRRSLADLGASGAIGALLAVLVLYAFLRHWPTTLVVSLAVPVALLITLAVMYFLGLTINVMSMMGMMLAIGMLVDNSVVVTESIFRHAQQSSTALREAALRGVREVGIATLAGTATSVVVFLPVVFGAKNELTIFLMHVAIPIVVSISASLLISHTLVPVLIARFRSRPLLVPGSLIDRVGASYEHVLRWLLARISRPLLLLGGLLLLTIALLVASAKYQDRFVKVDMFPQDAGRQLVIVYNLQGTHPIERVAAAVSTIEAYLEANKRRFDIDDVYSRYDQSDAATVLILSPQERQRLAPAEVIALVTKGLPDVVIGKPSFRLDDQGLSSGFSLQVMGESTETLATLADDLVRVLRGAHGLESVRSEARDGDEEVQIIVDRARVAALGLSGRQVALAVAAALRGDRLRELRGRERETTMRLTFRADDRQSIDDLAQLPIYLPGGTRVTLGSVASFRLQRGPRAIERLDRVTSVAIVGTLKPQATLQSVGEEAKALLARYQLPPGYSWKLGRSFEQDDEAQKMMLQNIVLALLMIYLVMAALFESTMLPVSVITSIVMAAIGVAWTMFASRTTVTFMALLGFQVLMGVIVNIGIVLVAHINDLRNSGLARLDAVVRGSRHRLRPVLMTTLTTALGLLPLAVGDSQLPVGTAGPSYAPMAIAIMGGLLFGAAVSILAVPVFYVWLDDTVAASRRMLERTRMPAARASKVTAAAP
jgi:HAE1 family hydrophobic/amphiphilic exporter-1